MTILIRNVRVIDPSQPMDEVNDLFIREGKVTPPFSEKPDRLLDGTGLIAMPGLIDVHVHLREPGNEAAETLRTGCAAALAGGFTSIVCMPNTTPPLDNPEIVTDLCSQVEQLNLVRLFVAACVTVKRAGESLTDFEQLKAAGAVAVTDDGDAVPQARLLRRALEEASRQNLVLADHCEDHSLADGGVVNEGDVSRKLGVKGRPACAEDITIARDIILAEDTGARLHLQHLSTARSAHMVREAKARGVAVTAEVTPHHLTLTETDIAHGDANFKMNPPLRTAEDVEALREALREGVLDCVATDHAPHTAESKALPLPQAPSGVIGMETALAVLWSELVYRGHLSETRLVECMSLAPARAFGIEGGCLKIGSRADVTLFDPQKEWTVRREAFRSKSRNCPFAGRTLRGKVMTMIVGGDIRYEAD